MTTMNKRIKRTAVSRWMAMTAAALTLGACSQSEEAVEMLPEGKYPIELTATGLEPAVAPMTRATVDGDWSNVTTPVAVLVDGVVKKYGVDASGSANKKEAVLKSDTDPFYWKSTADIKVSAWWPYSATKPTTVTLVTDQDTKEEYEGSDALEAVEQTVQYAAPTLKFTHRTAKMCVNVVNGSDTPAPMAVDGVEVSLGSNTVKPYNEAVGNYRCLIPGGTATEANKLSVKITIDGATYVYTHPSAYTFEANKQYTFTLTVNRDGIQLNECTISDWDTSAAEVKGEAKQPGYTVDEQGLWHIYNADGLKAWADAVSVEPNGDISAILENNITMPALQDGETSNWEPAGKKHNSQQYAPDFRGTFYGNDKTISGLVINSKEVQAGFIGNNFGTVKNLTLVNATIKGVQDVGGVVGYNRAGGIIEDCHVKSSSIETLRKANVLYTCVGGIVGTGSDLYYCSVSADCTVSSPCTDENDYIGGLVGLAFKGTFQGCYAACKLVGKSKDNYIGGLFGKAESSNKPYEIYSCYANCSFDIPADQDRYVGGIAGVGYEIWYSDRQGEKISGVLWNARSGNVTKNFGDVSEDRQLSDKINKVSEWGQNGFAMLILGLSDKTQEYEWKLTGDSTEPYVIGKKQQ